MPSLITARPICYDGDSKDTAVSERLSGRADPYRKPGACSTTPLGNEIDREDDTERAAERYKTKPLAQSERPAPGEQAV